MFLKVYHYFKLLKQLTPPNLSYTAILAHLVVLNLLKNLTLKKYSYVLDKLTHKCFIYGKPPPPQLKNIHLRNAIFTESYHRSWASKYSISSSIFLSFLTPCKVGAPPVCGKGL